MGKGGLRLRGRELKAGCKSGRQGEYCWLKKQFGAARSGGWVAVGGRQKLLGRIKLGRLAHIQAYAGGRGVANCSNE
jgi:hypothetical protein